MRITDRNKNRRQTVIISRIFFFFWTEWSGFIKRVYDIPVFNSPRNVYIQYIMYESKNYIQYYVTQTYC